MNNDQKNNLNQIPIEKMSYSTISYKISLTVHFARNQMQFMIILRIRPEKIISVWIDLSR